jgi:predicted metalloprotease with PDZ domain
MTVTVRPIRAGGAQVIAAAVREEIRGTLDQSPRPASWRIGIVYTSRAGIADRVDSLFIHDAAGPVPTTIENDPENKSGYTYYRHWRAQRRVQPPVIVTYRIRPVAQIRGGPQYDFDAHDSGLSAHGSQLFVLPESLGTANIRLAWDLSDLPPRSIAVGTYGEGDVQLRARPDTLVGSFFLAGPVTRYEPPTPHTGFHAYWLGRPAYDSRKEMAWLFQAYENMRTFYHSTDASPYRVFIRAVGAGGGTASGRSFMGSVPAGDEDSTKQGPRVTIAHEIGHHFVGGLRGGGPGGTPWYGEGVNTHYTRLLLLRAGLLPFDDYAKEINTYARNYYTNPYRNLGDDSLRIVGYSTGFGTSGAQNLAYSRGAAFWSDMDLRIRVASDGRRKLDDVLVPLIVAREQGQPFTQAILLDALVKELGPSARERFDAVITRGGTLVPASNAFGPCLERRPTKYTLDGKEYDGFEWVRVPSIPDARCRDW